MGRFSVEFDIANHEDVILARRGSLPESDVRRVTLSGVVDTGATRLVLPGAVVKQLGLPSSGKTRVRYADGRRASRPMVRDAEVRLLGRTGTFAAAVEPKRDTALIGAMVLEDLDFIVDPLHECLVPRDPDMIVSELE
ncbi:MAG: aspartyl protease family protein [Planctomycetes bacterium]|nr:aspartyl protease family protein [Planctomycetota bacterium]